MTPREKAKELLENFFQNGDKGLPKEATHINWNCAKQCALICVDEIINVCPYVSKENCDTVEQIRAVDSQFITYWLDVKNEIEKL